MVRQVEAGSKRWLLKAVREAAGELSRQFAGLDEDALRWRSAPSEWCLKEIAAHLRDAEHLYRRQIETIARGRRRNRLPYEAIDILPSERDYRSQPLQHLVWQFEEAREETVWLLYSLDETSWEQTGEHPYRGQVSIYDIARELHEHDLDHLFQAQRLRDQVLNR
jgi:hypothetical protein